MSDESIIKGEMSIKTDMVERSTPVEHILRNVQPEDEAGSGDSCERTGKIKFKSTPIFIETTKGDAPVHPICRRTSIGRSNDCDIVIDDIGVSRHHLAVTTEEDGSISIEDLGSTNGTYLNNERITHSKLHDGDEVVIGKTKLLFRTNSNQDEDS